MSRVPLAATEWHTRQFELLPLEPAASVGAVSPTWIDSTAPPKLPLPPTAPVRFCASCVPYEL